MALLLDTGIVYALADRDDAWHERAAALVAARPDALLLPEVAVAEVTYLLHRRLGAEIEREFARSLERGEIDLESLELTDRRRIPEILSLHPEIGFVDAAIVAVAERLNLSEIATTDRRHFARVRPVHREAFELVP